MGGVWSTACLMGGAARAEALRREMAACARRRGHPPRNMGAKGRADRRLETSLVTQDAQTSKDESWHIVTIAAAYRALCKTLQQLLGALKKSWEISVEKRPFDCARGVPLVTFSNAVLRQ